MHRYFSTRVSTRYTIPRTIHIHLMTGTPIPQMIRQCGELRYFQNSDISIVYMFLRIKYPPIEKVSLVL